MLSTGTVFLNDWGCAVPMGSSTTFSGSLIMAPNKVLMGIQAHGIQQFLYVPQAADDLEMVVKCFFGRLNAVFHTLPSPSDDIKKDVTYLIKFWDEQLAPEVWRGMLDLAQKENYDDLTKQIQKLLA